MARVQDEAGLVILRDVVRLSKEAFSSRFLAGYALGSLARGGFSPLVSDVDFGLILKGPLRGDDGTTVDSIKENVLRSDLPLAHRLSVFWGSPESLRGEESGGRFPPFDKLDLLAHGRLLAGEECRDGISRPDRRELEVSSIEFALDHLASPSRMPEYGRPELIVDKGERYTSKTVLYPPRFLYTSYTGDVAGNDRAVEFYLRHNEGPDAELVAEAFRWRMESLPKREVALKLLRRGLVPLYRKFLEHYLQRMRAYAEDSVAERVVNWVRAL